MQKLVGKMYHLTQKVVGKMFMPLKDELQREFYLTVAAKENHPTDR